VPGPYAEVLADSDVGASRGELNDASGDLRRLIGRPTTPLADAVAVAFKR
jgi:NAD(P)H dehydrogenase (quinone)